MRRTITALVSVSVVAAGCTTASKDLTPSYASPIQYQGYDCLQIQAETTRVQSRVVELGGRLDEAASNDKALTGVGIILFWPALFALGGNKTQEAEYSRLKGEHQALEQMWITKKCATQNLQASASPAQTSASVALTTQEVEKRLVMLQELRAKGLLSEDEYKTKRASVLDLAAKDGPTLSATAASAQEGKPTSPTATAPKIGLGAGDRLTYREFDSVSKVSTGEVVVSLDAVEAGTLKFNGGSVLMGEDGTPIKGAIFGGFIYGYQKGGQFSSGKFRVPLIKDDVKANLRAIGEQRINIQGRDIQVVRFAIEGWSSRNIALSNFLKSGSPFTGEISVDMASGMIVAMNTKSDYQPYEISRRLVEISR